MMAPAVRDVNGTVDTQTLGDKHLDGNTMFITLHYGQPARNAALEELVMAFPVQSDRLRDHAGRGRRRAGVQARRPFPQLNW
jgi:hypothetical protein